MIKRKEALQREQTSTSIDFLTSFSNEQTVLTHMIRNIVTEELEAHEAVLQEIVNSNLKVTKQLEDETKVI